MAEEKKNFGLAMIAIVAIVAIVGVVSLIRFEKTETATTTFSEENVGGQAIYGGVSPYLHYQVCMAWAKQLAADTHAGFTNVDVAWDAWKDQCGKYAN
ncbi:MAG TPA: hypothetical protein VJ461_03405 [Candidatus Nanoarchaeia archaeon]|nr:hypothetical protein [Candidatus Nanoarchaeia archaeon]